MSTHRTFTIEAAEHFQITLEIELRVMHAATAAEVNSFWHESERVLAYAEGDAVRAVALRAALFLLKELLAGCGKRGALEALSKAEGWPIEHGITVLDFEVPELDLHFLQILQESAR